ncbi:MAG: amidohydrolase [Bacteroidetes bacterium RIFCSPLOWO2_02_FULL_36_8]|nr:MAG: amidohydrolase [Bacteroidetes bacterium RIFCSPLOWO2_02_FULL_36_8]OFY72091.1 MAG: amidohydrolase [Bacteroidetes bacterium RIFCSPLOWO2_12_FULL_37_12]
MPTSPLLKVTLIQTSLVWEDINANLHRFNQLLGTIPKNSTDLVILPEMFSTGFTMNAKLLGESQQGKTVSFLKEHSKKLNATLTGSHIVKEDTNYYNRLQWVTPNGKIKSYNKRHLFRMAKEEKTYTPGKEKLSVTLNGWKICPLICYDLRFPVWCRNKEKYDLLIFIANWPEKRSSHWKLLLQARAVENQCYVIGVNRVGEDGNKIYYSGDSMLVDPKGEELFHSSHEEIIKTITLDKNFITGYRNTFPAFRDADNFDIR